MYAPLLWKGEPLGVLCVDTPAATREAFRPESLRFLVAVAHHAAVAIAQRQLQDDLQRQTVLLERLLTSFSPRMRAKLLGRSGQRFRPGGDRSEVTILVSDIRGFTKLTASMDVDDVVDMLNEYFSSLVETIFAFDGTIDKFIGDGILAVFGSPEPDADQHVKAVRAAWAMQEVVQRLNAVRRAARLQACEIGVGLHCGEVIHGFIGSAERMEFTVIGDAVNRASRFCDAAAAGEILLSPELHQRVWNIVDATPTVITTKHEGSLRALRLVSAPR
jgi:adenylate cyclase